MKEEHGYYEILLSHMVIFTRNVLPEQTEVKDISEFERIFEELAMGVVRTQAARVEICIEDIDTDDIVYYSRTVTKLREKDYRKTPADFYDDMSRYEFGMGCFYYYHLMRLLRTEDYENVSYTDEEIAIIIYALLDEKLEYRAKHDTQRDHMPWLLYLASQVVAKNSMDDEDEETDED